MKNFSHLKQIPFDEFKEITLGMKFFNQGLNKILNKEILNKEMINSPREIYFPGFPLRGLVLALEDMKSFTEEITIISGYAKCTPLENFLQGSEINVKVSDAFTVKVIVEGYAEFEDFPCKKWHYLMLKTSSGSFIFSLITPVFNTSEISKTSWVEIITQKA